MRRDRNHVARLVNLGFGSIEKSKGGAKMRLSRGWDEIWPKEGIIQEWYKGRLEDVWAMRYATLTGIQKEGALKFKDKEMWIFPEFNIRWTYKEFDRLVNNVAYCLREDYGIEKGDRVAIMMTNIPEFVVSYLAIARIGAISVIINARLAAEEVQRQIIDSGSIAIIVERGIWDKVKDVPGRVPRLRYLFMTGREAMGGWRPFSELMEKEAPIEVRADISERDVCSLVYTSGTTGIPKACIITHRNIANNAMNDIAFVRQVYGTKIEDMKQLIAVPMFHVTALHTLINMCLMGCTAVVMSVFKAKEAVDCLIDEKIDFSIMVTAMFLLMSQQPRYPELVKAGTFTHILQGGSPLPPEVAKKVAQDFPNAKITNGYGFSEGTSVGWCMMVPPDEITKRPACVGGVVGAARVRIVDEEYKDVPRGQYGEIAASGAGICEGYWNRPEETAKSFITDEEGRRWFLSGDIGLMTEDGYCYVVDRKKDMISRGGEKVFCVELENLLGMHPKVLAAGVVGVPDPVLGEKIKAVIQLMPGETLTEEEIKEFCRARIADFKVPDYVVFTDQPLPVNPGGKLIKPELKKM